MRSEGLRFMVSRKLNQKQEFTCQQLRCKLIILFYSFFIYRRLTMAIRDLTLGGTTLVSEKDMPKGRVASKN